MLLKSWKERLIAIGIAILFLLFNIYAIKTFLEVDSQRDQFDIDKFFFDRNGERYAMYFFIVAGISGILAIVIGAYIEVESVGSGLIGGGILLLVYGSIRYWWYASNGIKVLILGIALGILVVVGVKKFRNRVNVKKNAVIKK